jgi:hypothetical protein
MNVELRADNRPDAEPARGFERRAGLEPERGLVEEGAEKSKGAVSKSVVPLTGDRRFESFSLHQRVRLAQSAFSRRLRPPGGDSGSRTGSGLILARIAGEQFPPHGARARPPVPGLGRQIEESMAVAIDGEIFQDSYLVPLKPEIYLIPKIGGG